MKFTTPAIAAINTIQAAAGNRTGHAGPREAGVQFGDSPIPEGVEG